MRRSHGWMLAAFALLAATSLRYGATGHAQQAPAAPAAGGQAFAVRLTPAPAAHVGTGASSCVDELRARLVQLTLQFVLSPSATSPTVTVAPSELPSPAEAKL